MSRRMKKDRFALLVNMLADLNDVELDEALTVRTTIRAGGLFVWVKKGKKAEKKPKPEKPPMT